MTDKINNWSEGHDRTDDIMQGVYGEDDTVDDLIVKKGVIITNDCRNCGQQVKSIIAWGEICCFYIGEGVPDTKATRQGVWFMSACKACNKTTPVCIDWDEVRRYVDVGIRIGAVDPRIKTLER